MRKLMLVIVVFFCLVAPVFAGFKSEVTILDKAEIVKLSDDKLTESYADVLVEIEAIKTFHTTSGFKPEQYDEYRNILKYRLKLLMEIHGRNLELPQQMER